MSDEQNSPTPKSRNRANHKEGTWRRLLKRAILALWTVAVVAGAHALIEKAGNC